jgi:hypothetical protein
VNFLQGSVLAAPTSPIESKSLQLSDQAERLSKAVAGIESRLSLVLQPRACGAVLSQVAAPSPPVSPHLGRLEGVLAQNDRSIKDLENLLNYLDI